MKKLLLLLTALFALTAAAQDPVVTVTPSTTNMGKISAYNSSFTLTGTDGQTWNVAGFNNNNLGWATDPMRCGWKTSATSATITTNFAITEAVDKITFDVWRRNAGANDKQLLKYSFQQMLLSQLLLNTLAISAKFHRVQTVVAPSQ